MFVRASACLHWRDTRLNFHVVNLTSQVTTVSQEVLTGLLVCGMLEQDNALKHSEATTMRFWMHALIALETNLPLQVLMEWQECIMFSLELVLLFCKVMKMRSVKFLSIPRGTKSLQQVATRPAEFGQPRMEMNFKCWMVMRTKFSLVPLTMRVTP